MVVAAERVADASALFLPKFYHVGPVCGRGYADDDALILQQSASDSRLEVGNILLKIRRHVRRPRHEEDDGLLRLLFPNGFLFVAA